MYPEALQAAIFEEQRKSSKCLTTLPLYYDHLSGHSMVASHGGLVTLFGLDTLMLCLANEWIDS